MHGNSDLPQKLIDIGDVRPLQACVLANGEHFEHKM